MTKTLRDFSAIGPCITLGPIVRETATAWTYASRTAPARSGGGLSLKRKTSHRARAGLLHDQPCVSCRDHPETMYPHGYMD